MRSLACAAVSGFQSRNRASNFSAKASMMISCSCSYFNATGPWGTATYSTGHSRSHQREFTTRTCPFREAGPIVSVFPRDREDCGIARRPKGLFGTGAAAALAFECGLFQKENRGRVSLVLWQPDRGPLRRASRPERHHAGGRDRVCCPAACRLTALWLADPQDLSPGTPHLTSRAAKVRTVTTRPSEFQM